MEEQNKKDLSHIPVMLDEVIEYLEPKAGGCYLDATLGGGGYTRAIAKIIGEKGKVVAVDMDEEAIKAAKEKLEKENLRNIIFVLNNFANAKEIAEELFDEERPFDGAVFDLGLSSRQLDDPTRGFSFRFDSPLDMSFGPDAPHSTKTIVNRWREEDLEKIFRDYGEERFAGRIAKAIVAARRLKPINTTGELVDVIGASIPGFAKANHKIHFATRVFQALRIATNGELDNLLKVLPDMVDLIKPGGRIVIVSFHSLEDRIIKNSFKDMAKTEKDPITNACRADNARLKIITPKVVKPSREEIIKNPRSRSAKLRAGQIK